MGGSKQTQTSTATPYSAAKPLINAQASAATDYINNPNSPERQAAQSSADYYQNVVNGDYLKEGNPYTQAVIDSITSSVMPSVNGTFSSAGLDGSTLHQGSLTKALTQGMAQPLFSNYQNERSMQQNAAAALPGAALNASDTGAALNTLPISSSLTPYASQTQTSQTKQPLWQTIAGGGLAAAGLLAAPYTGGASLSTLGAMQGMMGNPAGMDMGLNNWGSGTTIRPPWQQY